MVLKQILLSLCLGLCILITGCSSKSSSSDSSDPILNDPPVHSNPDPDIERFILPEQQAPGPFINISSHIQPISSAENHIFIIKNGKLYTVGNSSDAKSTKEWTQLPTTNIKKIVQNYSNALMLKEDGSLWGAGKNYNREIGLANTGPITRWQLVLTNVKDVQMSNGYSIAIKHDNTLWAAGRNQYTFGNNQSYLTTWQQIFTNVKSATIHSNRTLVIDRNHTLWGAGDNEDYAMLPESTTIIKQFKQITTNVKLAATAYDASSIVKLDNTVWGIGRNRQNSLQSSSNLITNWKQLNVSPNTYIQLAHTEEIILLDNQHRLSITAPNRKGWKTSTKHYKEIFSSPQTSKLLAIDLQNNAYEFYISNMPNFKQKVGRNISTGSPHYENSILITPEKKALIRNAESASSKFGNLGQYNWKELNIPSPFKSIYTQSHSNFAIDSQNILWVIGENTGFGFTDRQDRQQWTQTLSNVAKVSPGRYHTLALRKDGTLWGSGHNYSQELGLSTENITVTRWRYLDSEITDIATGYEYSLILTNTGNVLVVGENNYGQIGAGNTEAITSWNNTLTNTQKIYSNNNTSFAIKNDHTLWATGRNTFGQLGNGTTTQQNQWIQVLTNVKDIKQGEYHTIALKTDNTVWGTGYNGYGQLGLNNTSSRRQWTQLYSEVKEIGATQYGSIIITLEGDILATGQNNEGELGLPEHRDYTNWTPILENL